MSSFSDLKVFPLNLDNSNLVAKGSVVVNNIVRFNFSVMNGSKGRFVSMPSEKSNKTDENGKTKYFPVVSLLSKDMQEELNRLVLAELDGTKVTSSKPTYNKSVTGTKKKYDDVPF